MGKQLAAFFQVPQELRTTVWEDAVQKNRVSLWVICGMIFGMELYNMARVLFWSASGLGTWNNRIYFGMYCALFLSAALYLCLAHWLRRRPAKARFLLQYGAVVFFLLWHAAVNIYDLWRDPASEVSIYFTAVLGLAVFIQMPPPYAALAHLSAYILFMGFAGGRISPGTRLNLTFTAIVALALSLTSFRHAVVFAGQREEIGRMNRRLQVLAQRDPLTGLLNQQTFQQGVQPQLGQAGAERPVTLLIVDLDNFKAVNDSYGHPCGDFVLKEVALRLSTIFADAAGVGRIGGDEFAVLVVGMEEEQLEQAAHRLIHSVAGITWHGKLVGAGCSVGGCRIAEPEEYERLYEETDRALYEAKRQGKGRFCLRCRTAA